jgi:hypothetical protein
MATVTATAAPGPPRPRQQWVTDSVKLIDCEPSFFTFTL